MINLIGGLAVGVLQKHMAIGDAVSTYSLLTVGEGLVSQIPALLISMSSGLIVTRAATDDDLGSDLLAQFTRYKKALQVGGGFVIVLALIPGLPKLPFIVVGACTLLVASRLQDDDERHGRKGAASPGGAAAIAAAGAAEAPSPDSPQALANEMRVEPLELEIAYDLVDLVDPARGGDLLDRVRALRRKLRGRARRRDPAGPYAATTSSCRSRRTPSACTAWSSAAAKLRPAACSCSATTSASSPARRPASRCSGSPRCGCPPRRASRPSSPAPRSSTARR